ncbi:MAG: replicative DNA helicase [Bacteroidales bacterium]|nr:replicative DNA helicase [Bacteroidales bacterium]HOY39559.1 replicative DNA helicase [Bacteroidales bacterium]HQP04001.1 replicative DNA helicase [Bacteroidales bacterium]
MANNSAPYKKNITQINEEYGRIPPQAVDLEEAVLGALLIEPDAIYSVVQLLTPDSFYKMEHRTIFESILNLYKNHQPIDLLTVTEYLRKTSKLEEVGGPFYISSLTNRIGTSAHIEYHSRIIQQKYIQRELIRVSSEIQQKAFDDSLDVDKLLNFSESEIFKISEGHLSRESLKISQLIPDVMQGIEEASKREDKLLGIPSGFSDLDRLTAGWQPGDLVIVAARPSMGKTAFVLSMARNMAVTHKKEVAIFSLEMANAQLVHRLISIEAELPGDKLKTGNLRQYEWKQLESKTKNLENAPIFVDDTPAITIFELKSKCRRLVQHRNIKAVFIDYLQLMTTGMDMKGSREQEVSTISRSLKAIAKELGVPVIALSQLNRAVEVRTGDKRPHLSDLRESGAIEQDADMVIFIHRPEYYNQTEDRDGRSTVGLAEIIIAKHRNGPTGVINLRFKSEYAKFTDPEVVIAGVNAINDGNTIKVSSKINTDEIKNHTDVSFSDGKEYDHDSGDKGNNRDSPF